MVLGDEVYERGMSVVVLRLGGRGAMGLAWRGFCTTIGVWHEKQGGFGIHL